MTLNPCKITAAVVSCRPRLVGRCVSSLLSQSMAYEDYEILVVADYAEEPVKSDRVRYIHDAPKSIAAKRNVSLGAAKGEIVAFTDDDCVADPKWLEAGLLFLDNHPNDVGVQGQVVVPIPENKSPNFGQAKWLKRPLYQTCNMFYRKEAIVKEGGFDERFAFQREDVDLGFTLVSRNYHIGYEARAIINHPVREKEYWDLVKGAFRKRYDPLLVEKHPKLFREHFGKIIPGSFKTMLLSWCVFVAALFISPYAVLCAACLLCSMAAALTLRRHKGANWGAKGLLASFFSFLIAPIVAFLVVVAGAIRCRG